MSPRAEITFLGGGGIVGAKRFRAPVLGDEPAKVQTMEDGSKYVLDAYSIGSGPFGVIRKEVSNLAELLAVLRACPGDGFAVRGDARGETRIPWRIKNASAQQHATLFEGPLEFVHIDFDDHILCPLDTSFDERVRLAREALPPEFQIAGCVAQATSSCGVQKFKDGKPEAPGVSVRLYYLCERGVWNHECKALFDGISDAGIYNAANPIYICDPTFDGIVDPFAGKQRWMVWPGEPLLKWPANAPPGEPERERAPADTSTPPTPEEQRAAERKLDHWLQDAKSLPILRAGNREFLNARLIAVAGSTWQLPEARQESLEREVIDALTAWHARALAAVWVTDDGRTVRYGRSLEEILDEGKRALKYGAGRPLDALDDAAPEPWDFDKSGNVTDAAPRGKGGVWNFVDVTQKLPPREWLCRDLRIARGRPAMLAGHAGGGKTIIAQSLALSVVSGKPIWGRYPCRQGTVLHLDYEMGDYDIIERYQRLARGMDIDLASLQDKLRVAALPRMNLCSDGIEDALVEICTGVTLCVVDSLRAAAPKADENESSFRDYVDIWLRVSQATGCTALVLHHANKNAKTDEPEGWFRGTGGILQAGGACYTISPPDKTTKQRVLRPAKTVHGEAPGTCMLSFADPPDGGLVVVHSEVSAAGESAESGDRCPSEALLLAACGRSLHGVAANDLREAVGGKRDRVAKLRDALVDAGELAFWGKRYIRADMLPEARGRLQELLLVLLRVRSPTSQGASLVDFQAAAGGFSEDAVRFEVQALQAMRVLTFEKGVYQLADVSYVHPPRPAPNPYGNNAPLQ